MFGLPHTFCPTPRVSTLFLFHLHKWHPPFVSLLRSSLRNIFNFSFCLASQFQFINNSSAPPSKYIPNFLTSSIANTPGQVAIFSPWTTEKSLSWSFKNVNQIRAFLCSNSSMSSHHARIQSTSYHGLQAPKKLVRDHLTHFLPDSSSTPFLISLPFLLNILSPSHLRAFALTVSHTWSKYSSPRQCDAVVPHIIHASAQMRLPQQGLDMLNKAAAPSSSLSHYSPSLNQLIWSMSHSPGLHVSFSVVSLGCTLLKGRSRSLLYLPPVTTIQREFEKISWICEKIIK